MRRAKSLLTFRLLVVGAIAALCASCGPSSDSSGSRPSAASPGGAESAQRVETAKVVSQRLNITARLPGELRPYEVVAVFPKVTGFVKWIGVDRGSRVKQGEMMARLEAPELVSQRGEAEARLESARSQLVAVEARLASDEGTYQRLKAASSTPGVVAGNDLVVAEKAAEADRAQAKASEDNVGAARQSLKSLAEIEGYLQVKAPFDGMVTERNVHPGALVGPVGGPGVTVPMVRLEKVSRLRLVVPVPEDYAAGIAEGIKVNFTVPAFPGATFSAPVARIAHSVDVATRTMPVELDVPNASGRLDPGMFPEVLWPVRRLSPTLFAPASAVTRTTERIFVVRVRNGETEWVDVKTGATSGNLIEVFGDLREGDDVALRGTDELRPGTAVTPRQASTK
jgi:membrane fusion protein, multidrug efflux system